MTPSSTSGGRSFTDMTGRRGQATIETMLIAFLGVVFLSVAFQFYLTNRSVSRTLQEVHGKLLSGMWEYNNQDTEYNRETIKVIWTAQHGVPSASSVPRVGLLQDDLPDDLRIYSHWQPDPDTDQKCEPSSPPCKRIKAGGGLDAGDFVRVALDSAGSITDGDYFGWLAYNGENAAMDIVGLHETLQDIDEQLETVRGFLDCLDDPWECAAKCNPLSPSDCPLDL
jgi:hypothetical protein